MVAAAFLFMRRMSEVANITAVTSELADDANGEDLVPRRRLPPRVEVFEISGPFFFGVAETFRETVGRVSDRARVLIIRLRHVPSIDSSGLHALRELVHRTRREGTAVLLTEVAPQPLYALTQSGMFDEIGEGHVHAGLDDALDHARALVAGDGIRAATTAG
jgi:SulP family sulfate permease